jgi:hypothetical protein
MLRKSRAVAALVAALVLPICAWAQATPATLTIEMTAPDQPAPALKFPLKPQFRVRPLQGLSAPAAQAQAAAGQTVPLWQGSETYAGTTYSFRMVGNNPGVAQTNQTTSVPAYLIPVEFQFIKSAITLDPTQPDPKCSPAGTPFNLIQASPIFSATSLASNGTNLGTGQYDDLFQRGNFWIYTNPAGINPNYHVVPAPNVIAGQKLIVKVTSGPAPKTGNGICGALGEIDLTNFDNYLQKTVIPALPKAISTATLPVFLLYNVVMYEDHIPALCCVLGYHGAMNRNGVLQTYSVAEYDTTGAFTNTSDVSILSHEIGEWLDDPTGTNPTPKWGHTGQVSGCQSNLEVGDPLSGSFPLIDIPMPNGVTYHVQDLAFLSWFYRMVPSIGVNGYYSLFGTFTTPAATCP